MSTVSRVCSSAQIITILLGIVSLWILSPTGWAAAPTVDFKADRTLGEPGMHVAFRDTSAQSGAAITAWSWDFGDSTTSTAQHPTHTYNTPGRYTVTLRVTTSEGVYKKIKTGYIRVAGAAKQASGTIDLSQAVIVTNASPLPTVEQTAVTVLVEEVQKRTGLTWSVTETWPSSGIAIALTSQDDHPGLSDEGYHLFWEDGEDTADGIWIVGADTRGEMYGVGKLLRSLTWATGAASLSEAPDVTTSPESPLRGHQIGYRNTANSYDAWDVDQYEQYVRELVLFGANAIENIPFASADESVHFPVTPTVMNQSLSQLCENYGIEYWVWVPAEVNLADSNQYAALRAEHEALYQNCVRLDGVFVPGGDPGSNSPDLVMTFLQDIAGLLATYHPDAGVWVSNQGFEPDENDWFFNYLQTQRPSWLAGVVFGPWTKLSIAEERQRTPSQYPIRRYPDITHNVRCQYPVPEWDRAYAHVLNREAPNPRPLGYGSDLQGVRIAGGRLYLLFGRRPRRHQQDDLEHDRLGREYYRK